MQHPDEGTIHSWLDGALTADETARVETHVKDCPECAAAVAEARGFIAASSRILSALDNAPRGVIPAAKPIRRVDPMVWRIAATLLVVAGGTILVVENQGGGARFEASKSTTTLASDAADSLAGAATLSAPTSAPAAAAPTVAAGTVPSTSRDGGNSRVRATKTPAAADNAAKVAAQQPAAESLADFGAANRQRLAGAGSAQRSEAAVTAAPAPPPPPPPAAATFAPSRVIADVAAERAVEPDSLKVIASPRRIGATVTVYEVGGDTVTLTESKLVALQSVVVTGAAGAARTVEKAAAEGRRAMPATALPVDTQSRAATPAPPMPVQGSVSGQDVGGKRSITWRDAATGSTLTLTGRITEERLQQIRARIERERAAAPKKIPER